MPVDVGDYTDFYSSLEHATNVGTMLRGADNALQPNWLHLPVAYHGRASSIVVSGTTSHRPQRPEEAGRRRRPALRPDAHPRFRAGNGGRRRRRQRTWASRFPSAEAREHLFGLVLLNDWSARDIQAWEYVPLGAVPGQELLHDDLAVGRDAGGAGAVPHRRPRAGADAAAVPAHGRTADLRHPPGGVSARREDGAAAPRSARPTSSHLYWSLAQQLAHHTVNGCNLRTRRPARLRHDQRPTPDSYGSLLELTWRGTRPLPLPDGEQRTFLQDGDRVTLTGWCQGDGYRVGFGEATGKVLPAPFCRAGLP